MADKVYDAVIIGGGHHGTTIAPYLAKAGLKVGVFERLDHLGGGAVTEDLPSPWISREFLPHVPPVTMVTRPIRNSISAKRAWNTPFRSTNEAIIFDDETSYVAYAAFTVVVDPRRPVRRGSTRPTSKRLMSRLPDFPRKMPKLIWT